jgi:hypothetical protein
VVPGQPGKPECVDADKDHIKIKWTPPISNGGSKIIGYDVERRDRATGRWIKQNREPVKYPEYYDDHVTEGHQYEYRVSAINAAGAGKPSETSSVFTAKPMKEKPKLYLDALIGRKIKVRAGEPINVNIPLSGAPTPKIEWIKDGKSLAETLRLSVGLACLIFYYKQDFIKILIIMKIYLKSYNLIKIYIKILFHFVFLYKYIRNTS